MTDDSRVCPHCAVRHDQRFIAHECQAENVAAVMAARVAVLEGRVAELERMVFVLAARA